MPLSPEPVRQCVIIVLEIDDGYVLTSLVPGLSPTRASKKM